MEIVQNMQIVDSKMLVILHCAPCSLAHTLQITKLRNHNKIFSFILQYYFLPESMRDRTNEKHEYFLRMRTSAQFHLLDNRNTNRCQNNSFAKVSFFFQCVDIFSFYFYVQRILFYFFHALNLFAALHTIVFILFQLLFHVPKMAVENLFCKNMNNLVEWCSANSTNRRYHPDGARDTEHRCSNAFNMIHKVLIFYLTICESVCTSMFMRNLHVNGMKLGNGRLHVVRIFLCLPFSSSTSLHFGRSIQSQHDIE